MALADCTEFARIIRGAFVIERHQPSWRAQSESVHTRRTGCVRKRFVDPRNHRSVGAFRVFNGLTTAPLSRAE